MDGGWLLRSVRVKQRGPLHERLQKLLQQAWRSKTITQESLAKAIAQVAGTYSQENAGQYVRGGKAGALDLDQADAALRHIGSTLPDFLASVPPRELTETEKLAHALIEWPELADLVRDLMPVPKPRREELIELARGLGQLAIVRRGGRTAGSTSERQKAPRTKSAPRRRRSAQP